MRNFTTLFISLAIMGTMTITLGPATLAACPEGSRGEEFLQWLGAATSFTYQGEQFAILLNPESGMLGLGFEPAE